MKRLGLALVLAAMVAADLAHAETCNPTTILPNTLAYVSFQYGNFGGCQTVAQNWYACYYADGTLAALVTPTTAPHIKQFCKDMFTWYNCPRSGTACVPTAYVVCGGLTGTNWREQCNRTPF